MGIIDVSIDFDWFARELPDWDWGHSEEGPSGPSFLTTAWYSRYLTIDLWREANPFQWADTTPDKLLQDLDVLGLSFQRMRNFALAESHVQALPFLLAKSEKEPAATLLHFDAHHDAFTDFTTRPTEPVTTENWVQHYLDARPTTKVVWVPPKWKESDEIANVSKVLHRTVEVVPFEQLSFQRDRVRNVFLCRSGVWVPPHLDPLFVVLARALAYKVKKGHQFLLGPPLIDRAEFVVDRETADRERENLKAAWAAGVERPTSPPHKRRGKTNG